MTTEKMSNEELAEQIRVFRDRMLESGGRSWTLHIPAQDTDPDLLLTEVMSRLLDSVPKAKIEALLPFIMKLANTPWSETDLRQKVYQDLTLDTMVHLRDNLFTQFPQEYLGQFVNISDIEK